MPTVFKITEYTDDSETLMEVQQKFLTRPYRLTSIYSIERSNNMFIRTGLESKLLGFECRRLR